MQLFSALILGVIQGITEFLPVSSTAHLIIFPWLFGWEDPLINSLTFDVALHLGTLVAVLAYFWRDWLDMAAGLASSLKYRSLARPEERLAWMLAVATLPAVVFGMAFEKQAETSLRSPLLISFTLAFVALVMLWVEHLSAVRPRGRGMERMTFTRAAAIGLAQAAAIVPGVSRSGATITAGLALGFRRDAAARFSFLLSTPVVAGACVLKLRHVFTAMPPGEGPAFAVGAAASAVSGYLAIAFLINYLKNRPLNLFAYYRILLAVVVLVVSLLK